MAGTHSTIDVLLSARSSTAITLAEVEGEQVIAALGGDDAAAHLRVGDVVLSVNGRAPGRTPSNWKEEDANPASASVLALRVRRPAAATDSAAATPSAAAEEAVPQPAPSQQQPSGGSQTALSSPACGNSGVAATPVDATTVLEYAHAGSFGGYGLNEGLYSLPANLLPLPNHPTGDLVVCDGGGCRLQFVSPFGELRSTLGSRGSANGLFNYPSGLAVDAKGEMLYVCDRGNCRVQKLRMSDGEHLGTSAATLEVDTSTTRMGGGAATAKGRSPSRSADATAHAASSCAGDSASIGGVNAAGNADGGGSSCGSSSSPAAEELLNYPWGVALTSDDSLLIVSDMRGRLFVLDARSLALICCHTPRCGLGSPHAMAVYGAELFVADHDHHRVTVIALGVACRGVEERETTAERVDAKATSIGDPAPTYFTGSYRFLGSRGQHPGQFEHPVGLAIVDASPPGRGRMQMGLPLLLVSEFTGRRVQGLHAISGAPLFKLVAPSSTRLLGVAAAPMGSTLSALHGDGDGLTDADDRGRVGSGVRIYAGDFDLDRIHFWEPVIAAENHAEDNVERGQ